MDKVSNTSFYNMPSQISMTLHNKIVFCLCFTNVDICGLVPFFVEKFRDWDPPIP